MRHKLIGQFKPIDGADPTIGSVGVLEQVEEDRVEITLIDNEKAGKTVLNVVNELKSVSHSKFYIMFLPSLMSLGASVRRGRIWCVQSGRFLVNSLPDESTEVWNLYQECYRTLHDALHYIATEIDGYSTVDGTLAVDDHDQSISTNGPLFSYGYVLFSSLVFSLISQPQPSLPRRGVQDPWQCL